MWKMNNRVQNLVIALQIDWSLRKLERNVTQGDSRKACEWEYNLPVAGSKQIHFVRVELYQFKFTCILETSDHC